MYLYEQGLSNVLFSKMILNNGNLMKSYLTSKKGSCTKCEFTTSEATTIIAIVIIIA